VKLPWSKKNILFALFLLLIVCGVICSISYYMLSQFSFVRDNIFYGKKQSDIARDIRNELYMRHDTKPVSFFSKDSIKLA
jgi:hypothetical protein